MCNNYNSVDEDDGQVGLRQGHDCYPAVTMETMFASAITGWRTIGVFFLFYFLCIFGDCFVKYVQKVYVQTQQGGTAGMLELDWGRREHLHLAHIC